jgi:hypothetical protein
MLDGNRGHISDRMGISKFFYSTSDSYSIVLAGITRRKAPQNHFWSKSLAVLGVLQLHARSFCRQPIILTTVRSPQFGLQKFLSFHCNLLLFQNICSAFQLDHPNLGFFLSLFRYNLTREYKPQTTPLASCRLIT